MFLALARGVPEAGLTFALSMMTGVELTLAAVAALVIVGRDWFVGIVAGHDASTQRLARILKGITGGMLIMICLNEFWL
jgi:ABC-type nickel/cobalt efflux system permease component RcnA